MIIISHLPRVWSVVKDVQAAPELYHAYVPEPAPAPESYHAYVPEPAPTPEPYHTYAPAPALDPNISGFGGADIDTHNREEVLAEGSQENASRCVLM